MFSYLFALAKFPKKLIIAGLIALFLPAALGGFLALSIRRQIRLERQNVKAPEITLTIIEGWTITDIASYLETRDIFKAADFINLVKNFHTAKYGSFLPKNNKSNLEGFLFPDTYRIFYPKAGTTPANELIKKALENFLKKITPQMQARAAELNMSVYDVVILASIIEKEAGRSAVSPEAKIKLSEEKKNISGIFYNRLKAGLPLESDATINYVTGKSDPTPSAQDLKTASEYNTYLNKGLPPAPICNPGLDSILAALNPAATDYLYFLHKQPSGQAVFSKTFDEHVKNKLKYLK